MAFFLWLKQKKSAVKAINIILAAIMLLPITLLFLPVLKKPAPVATRAAKAETSRGPAIPRSDIYLMAKVIEGEAANEPYSGKIAVGAVIINRMENPDFPKTVPDVVYQKDAFEAVTNGQYNRPLTEESFRAAQEAVSGHDPTDGAIYYWNPAKATSSWIWSRPIEKKIGNHVFAY